MTPPGSVLTISFFLTLSLTSVQKSEAIRCYTNLEESKSLECGMATGCVKIVKKAPEFDPKSGKFIPEEERAKSVDLFKGCFLISAPDVCFNSQHDGLTYCWCSSNDLCNKATASSRPSFILLMTVTFMMMGTVRWRLGT